MTSMDRTLMKALENVEGKVDSITGDTTDYKAYDDTEVKTLINKKADKEHTHAISDITSLQSQLDSLANKTISEVSALYKIGSLTESSKSFGKYTSWTASNNVSIKANNQIKLTCITASETAKPTVEIRKADNTILTQFEVNYTSDNKTSTVTVGDATVYKNQYYIDARQIKLPLGTKLDSSYQMTITLEDGTDKIADITITDGPLVSFNTIRDIMYPVNSVYFANNNEQNPGQLLGGTWSEANTTSIETLFYYIRTA